ncbi:MAG: fasciclin domain-containing protein [bacterium]
MIRWRFLLVVSLAVILSLLGGLGYAADKNVASVLKDAGNFTTFLKALEATGMLEELSGEGPLTVFAPTDEAFANLENVNELFSEENLDKLTTLVNYHIVSSDKYTVEDLKGLEEGELFTNGGSIKISSEGNQVKIGDNINIIETIDASNGVIYVIDGVIVPQKEE